MPDVNDLAAYWGEFPPLHIAVQGFLGPRRPARPGLEIGRAPASLTMTPEHRARLRAAPSNPEQWLAGLRARKENNPQHGR